MVVLEIYMLPVFEFSSVHCDVNRALSVYKEGWSGLGCC